MSGTPPRATTNWTLLPSVLVLGILLLAGSAAAQGRERPLPPNLIPNSWYGYGADVFVPDDIYDQLVGPRLVLTRRNDRTGINGSDSCNVGYTSGSPQLPGQIGVQWGASPRWIQYTVDLEQFEHRAVAIRFRFLALDEYFNKHEGWFIDDIRITNLRSEPDPANRPGDHTWINGAETDVERNWMLANSSHGEKPGWHATRRRDRSGGWSWWYGNEDTGTYEAAGLDGSADPTPQSGDEPPAGQDPGFEDPRCNDAPNYGALMTPVMELGEDPVLSFWTLWETEGVLPIFDYKTIEIGIDTDRDGLLDVWEVHGVDVDGDDLADYRLEDLHPVPPNPERKDVYVEIDCMVASDHNDCPTSNVLSRASTILGDLIAPPGSPPMNPDGSDGIQLHAWVDSAVTHEPVTELYDDLEIGIRPSFFRIKEDNFDDRRACCVHYSLWAHAQPDFLVRGQISTTAGRADRPGPNSIVSLGFPTLAAVGEPDRFAHRQTDTFLHELGHNLGLGHGGDSDINFKPHYVSLMNYRFANDSFNLVESLEFFGNGDGICESDAPFFEKCERRLFFSEWTFGLIDEGALDETGPANGGLVLPIPNIAGAPEYDFSSTCPQVSASPQPIQEIPNNIGLVPFGHNWDCSTDPLSGLNTFSLTPVAVNANGVDDPNGDSGLTSLTSVFDVPLLDLVFGDDIAFTDASAIPKPIELPEAARRRFGEAGDQRPPDVRVVEGLLGPAGNPAVRLEIDDLPDPRRSAAELSGLRAIVIEGPNVERSEQYFAESPATTTASVTIESTDGEAPRFRIVLRDVAENSRTVEYPPSDDLVPPTARIIGADPLSASFEVEVSDDRELAATNVLAKENSVLLQRSGDATNGFRLRFARSVPSAPSRLDLDVVDRAGNRSRVELRPDSAPDRDGDGIPDAGDVCPEVADPLQADTDGDGVGDACLGTTTPDLAGLPRAAADAALAAASLHVGAISTAHHPTAPIDEILAHAPAAGMRVPAGRSIDLVVSSGPAMVAVPALIGLSPELAEAKLIDAGLVLGAVDSIPDRHVPIGLVAAQGTAPDVLVPLGTAIALQLSSGPDRVPVPDLRGLPQAEAEAALVAAGFTIGPVSTAHSSTIPAGAVVLTNPGAGLVLRQDTPVALVVSLGPIFTTMPSLIGLSYFAASEAATTANVFLSNVAYTTHPTAPAGLVFEQTPAAGASVPIETNVEVRISLGPGTTTVTVTTPQLVGVPEPFVVETLSLAQLNLGAVLRESSTTVPAGRVIRQSPVAGTRIVAGSAVDLVVSLGPEQIANLILAKRGPETAQAGEILRYSIDYTNSGNLAATDAVLSDVLPAGSTFISASDGGTFSFGTQTVTWPLGDLASGASGERTLDVRAACSTQPMINTASISASGIASTPSNPVTTSLSAAPSTPIAVEVATEPSRNPLQEGDSIRYAITLRNDTDADFRGVAMPLTPGSGSDFESVEDAGGGLFTGLEFRTWTWRGRVPPRSSVVVVVRARVQPCLNTIIEGIQLDDILLQTCGPSPGNARELATIPVSHDVEVRLTAPELFPTLGMSGDRVTTAIEQPVREGATFVLAIEVENRTDVARPDVSVSSVLPTDVVAIGDPPFVAPIDAGATWDPTTRTVAWSGALGPRETRRVPLEVQLTPGGSCRRRLTARGSTDSCTNDLLGQTELLTVPAVLAEPHLLGLDSREGPWRLRPDVDTVPQPLLCATAEILFGADQAPSGEIFVAGTPSYRFDPELPRLAYFGEAFESTVTGPGGPQDVAYDGTTEPPSLVFVGDKIWRYRLEDGSVETILDDPDVRPLRNVEIDAEGRILAASDEELIRVDPRTAPLPLPPGGYERIAGTPAYPFPTSTFGTRQSDQVVAFDTDAVGNTLAIQNASFVRPLSSFNTETTTIGSLVRLDADAGYAQLHDVVGATITRSLPPNPPLPATLAPLLQSAGRLSAAVFGDDGELYVASSSPGAVGVLDVGAPTTGRRLVSDLLSRSTTDLVWYTPEPRCSAPDDLAARAKPGKVDLTFTPSPGRDYVVLRADAGSGEFAEVGRTNDGVYVDYAVVTGSTYDYALDTVCRDRSLVRGAAVRATVPTGGGRGGDGSGSNPPEGGVPEPKVGLMLAIGGLTLAMLAARRQRLDPGER